MSEREKGKHEQGRHSYREPKPFEIAHRNRVHCVRCGAAIDKTWRAGVASETRCLKCVMGVS